MGVMQLIDAQGILNANGFPAGTPDGVYGPRTRVALQHFQLATTTALPTAGGFDDATAQALDWLPQLAPHFTVAEMRSKGNGNCYIKSELLHALESLRDNIGRPIPIASGYRDPDYNNGVPGAASRSLHMWGLAVDVVSNSVRVTLDDILALNVFSGVGWVKSSGYVRHLDMRHLTGYHKATPTNPSVWSYLA